MGTGSILFGTSYCELYPNSFTEKKIVLGGGVMKQQQLISMIRNRVTGLLNGYLQHENITSGQIEDYIVLPSLGENAGLCGALALAKKRVFQEIIKEILSV
ncbi:hypothetical protein GCM10020331_024810 [Ectobacillus funiculus]